MDWTDRHCRYFHRLLSRNTLLYTEMVTTGALRHGDVQRHLRFNAEEHPVALQLGGSDAADLAHGAKLGEQWGYNEINLNCGCPSDRVQRGAFGACLMNEPRTVADGVKAMMDVVSIPVTVKHRIGIDRIESYDFVRDFVGTVSDAGCKVFIVHARNAWLDGLSPKENREIPPLRYELGYQLKKDFPNFGHRHQRRHHHQCANGRALAARRWCDVGARSLLPSVADDDMGCRVLQRPARDPQPRSGGGGDGRLHGAGPRRGWLPLVPDCASHVGFVPWPTRCAFVAPDLE